MAHVMKINWVLLPPWNSLYLGILGERYSNYDPTVSRMGAVPKA